MFFISKEEFYTQIKQEVSNFLFENPFLSEERIKEVLEKEIRSEITKLVREQVSEKVDKWFKDFTNDFQPTYKYPEPGFSSRTRVEGSSPLDFKIKQNFALIKEETTKLVASLNTEEFVDKVVERINKKQIEK